MHALSGIPAHGWTGLPTILGLLTALAVAVLFAVRERRTATPLVPPVVVRSVPVTASALLLLITSGGLFGALFAATFLAQDELGLDPLTGALRVLPLTVSMILGAPIADLALRRYGPRRAAITGTLLMALGIAGLSALSVSLPLTGIAGGVLGAGFATVSVTATGTVVTDAPPGHAGVVGGLKQTAMNIGPALGTAIAAATMESGPTLPILAGFTALGLLPALLLPPARTPALRS